MNYMGLNANAKFRLAHRTSITCYYSVTGVANLILSGVNYKLHDKLFCYNSKFVTLTRRESYLEFSSLTILMFLTTLQ